MPEDVTPGYNLVIEPNAGLLRMRFVGFWTDETADRFGIALDEAIKRLESRNKAAAGLLYFADFRDAHVQSVPMVARFQAFAASAGTRATRIAVVVGSTLQKLQTQRMAAGYDHYRFYLAEEVMVAERWLINGHD